jgi:anti-anti-sigma factor
MKLACEFPPDRPGCIVARVRGTFDADGADLLWESVAQVVDQETRYVIFDFSDVSVLTSAALGILIRLRTRLQGFGGGLAIFGCSDKVREIIDIVMLAEVLGVRDTEDQARAALCG